MKTNRIEGGFFMPERIETEHDMTPQVITRRSVAEDLPDVLKLVQALAAHHGDTPMATLESLRRDCLGPAPWVTVIVAEADGIVGYAALCRLAQVQFGVRGMDIHHLFVARAQRAKGIGRLLIEASIAEAAAQQCRYLTVGTHPENDVAPRVYLNAGFDALPPPGPRFRIKLS
ncbi:GNAT family N-acetyltransferase [Sulfitobacter sp. SK012]|uniref:GNAT family N-acetyltransferase n=1 Tax=Sulfitobacter sp. SK012 TaxID=1389005 RepID=UPI000E0B72F9|nr:GNAT family N-acetyltransferase [Sulfitobacter sp. SK012]AXI44950.1 GNAT family N-acetyltransferase [Sulfitobacter sp. SK012]